MATFDPKAFIEKYKQPAPQPTPQPAAQPVSQPAAQQAQPPVSAPAAPVSPPAQRTERTVEAQPVETPPVDVGEGEVGFGRRMGRYAAEMITGKERRVPETEALPSWADMPEISAVRSLKGVANVLTGDVTQEELMAAATTLMTNPEETAKIIQAQFPGVKVRQDQKGNYIFKSPTDDKEYAIKPGFRPEDTLNLLSNLLVFSPAGAVRSILLRGTVAAATQSAIEGTQKLAGGEFDPEEVALAAGGEVVGPVATAVPRLGRKAVSGAADLAQRVGEVFSYRPPTEAVEGISPRIGGVSPVIEDLRLSAAPDLNESEINDLIQRAAGSGQDAKEAQAALVFLARTDEDTRKIAQDLGLSLPVDLFSDSVRLRSLANLARSQSGSEAETAYINQFKETTKQVDNLLNEMGASYSFLDVDGKAGTMIPSPQNFSDEIKGTYQSLQTTLQDQSENLWKIVNSNIQPTEKKRMQNVLNYFSKLSRDQGGAEQALDVLGQEGIVKEALKGDLTFARMDALRQRLGAFIYGGKLGEKYKGTSAQVNAMKELYDALKNDILDLADEIGGTDLKGTTAAAYETLSQLHNVRKEAANLLGKDMQTGLAGKLNSAINKTTGQAGSTDDFVNLLKIIPDEYRSGAIMTAIANISRSTVRGNSVFSFSKYNRAYEKIMSSNSLRSEVMKNLSKEQQKLLNSLFVVSKSVTKFESDILRTGKSLQAVINNEAPKKFIRELAFEIFNAFSPGFVSVAARLPRVFSKTPPAEQSIKKFDYITDLFNDKAFLQRVEQLSSSPREANRAVMAISRNPKMVKAAKALGIDVSTDLSGFINNLAQSARQGRADEALNEMLATEEAEETGQ